MILWLYAPLLLYQHPVLSTNHCDYVIGEWLVATEMLSEAGLNVKFIRFDGHHLDQ